MVRKISTLVHDSDPQSNARRAALVIARREGLQGLTFRSLAEEAEISVGSLQANFGKKEVLVNYVHEQVVMGEIKRLNDIESDLFPADTLENGLSLFKVLMHEQCRNEAPNQLLLMELLMAGLRNDDARPHIRQWLERVRRFWTTVFQQQSDAERFGQLLTELQIGLMLSTLGCHRSLEASLANNDLIDRIVLPDKHREPIWYYQLLARTVDIDPPFLEDSSPKKDVHDRLVFAGAQVLAKQGAAAVSYRSVAANSDVALSSVAYCFPKRSALIYAIYRRIYDEVLADVYSNPVPLDGKAHDARVEAAVGGMLWTGFAGVSVPIALAELYLLAARESDFADLAWHMRMTRGNYWQRKMNPDPAIERDAFESHLEAIWGLGCALIHMTTGSPGGARADLVEKVSFALPRMDRTLAASVGLNG